MDRKTYYTLIITLVLVGFAVSILLFPSGLDIAWMLFYNKQYEKSSKTFSEYFQGKTKEQREFAVPEVWLNLELANIGEAIKTVEEYLKAHPKALDARQYLGRLYQKANRPYDYLHNLEEIYKINPNATVLKELVRLYEETNSTDRQMGALNVLVKENSAELKDYKQLVQIYAAKGDVASASIIIHKMLQKFTPGQLDQETAVFAVNFLVSNGEEKQGFYLASNYIKAHPKDTSAIVDFVYKLSAADMTGEAELIESFIPANEQNSPKVLELKLSLRMQKQDEKGIFETLKTEYQSGKLLPSYYPKLVTGAIAYKDDALLNNMIDTVDFKKISESSLVPLVDTLISNHRSDIAVKLQEKLGKSYLEQHQLIDLGLTLASNETKEIKVEGIEKKFSEQQRAELSYLLFSSGDRAYSKAILETIQSLQNLESDSLDTTIDLYISLGLTDKAEKLLASYQLEPGMNREPVIRSQLFLLAATGKLDELQNRLSQTRKITPSFLADLYQVAEKTKQGKTAFAMASELYKRDPSQTNRTYLARALVLDGKIREGLKILREQREQGVNVLDAYVSSLVDAAKVDPTYKFELDQLVASVVKDKKIEQQKKRDIGYILIDNKMAPQATSIFFELAQGKSYSDSDTQSLLTLWGKKLSPVQMEWIQEQTVQAEGKNLAGWLEELAYNGQAKLAASIAEKKGWDQNKAVTDVYLNALEISKQRERLKRALNQIVESEPPGPRLSKMAKMSYDLGLYHTSEKAYVRLLETDPENPEPFKMVGMIKFVLGDYFAAKEYLECYLATPNPDYLGYYYYGELYWIYEHREHARQYLRTSLYLLTKMEHRDTFSELIEAEIYYRMRCYSRAMETYESIIARAPNMVSYNIDYANMLVLLEKYCRAAQMIANASAIKGNPADLDDEGVKTQAINLQVAKVRLLKELNKLQQAWCLANELVQKYPDVARVLEVKAELENLLGRWWMAVTWYENAIAIEPWSEYFKRLQRDIFCEKSSHVFMGDEYKLVTNAQIERIYDFEWSNRFNHLWVGKIRVSNDDMTLNNAIDPFTNTFFDFAEPRVRGEVALEFQNPNGLDVELALCFARLGVGMNLFITKKDFYGRWELNGMYNRQSWDYTQTIIGYGTEDRFSFYRTLNVGPRMELFGGGGYRWYNLIHIPNAAQFYTYVAGVNYHLRPTNIWVKALGDDGNLYLNYFIDAQYQCFTKEVFSPFLNQFVTPMNVGNRQTHVAQISFNKRFCPTFWIEGAVGASCDAASNHNEWVPTGAFIVHIGSKCGPRLRFQYIHTQSTQQTRQLEDRLIADVTIPY